MADRAMLRHYSYATVGQIVSVGLAVLALAVITRTLGPADYGIYIVLMTVVSLLSIAVAAGPQAATLVLSARDPERRSELHGQVVVATLALAALTAVVVALVSSSAATLIAPALAPGLVALNLMRLPPLVYTNLVASQLSGAGKIGVASSLAIASGVVAMLGPLGAVVAGDHLGGAILGSAAASYIGAGVTAVVARATLGLARPGGFGQWRAAIAIAIPMHIGTLAYWVMLRLDVIVVNAVLGRHDAGIYGLALGVSERVGMLTAPLYNATAWRVSGRDRAEALRVMLQVARLEFALGVLAAIGGIVLGPLLVFLVSGSAFVEASIPLAILVVGAAALPVWAAVGLYIVTHLDGAWTTAWIQVAVAIGSVIGYAVLTRLVGIVGAASVSTGAYLVLLACGLVLIHRAEPFRWKELLPGDEARQLLALTRGLVVRMRARI